jgi:hypothetical protein
VNAAGSVQPLQVASSEYVVMPITGRMATPKIPCWREGLAAVSSNGAFVNERLNANFLLMRPP